MAKVAWIVPSIGVFNNPDGELVIDSPITFIDLEVLPNNFSFDVSFGILELDELKIYDLTFEIFDPDSESIFRTTVQIDKNNIVKEHPDKEFIDIFVSNAHLTNFKFEKYGVYSIQLRIEGDIANARFNVIKGRNKND
ncbi:hypothetical protein [Staphylococcus borealis]|uniref:hypothetical protein n=1 Tax=Staphylococcus borealis TaxID=2742203 RepID=UPI00094718E8|nr:hypothetical protein [Staphylococcus borealis]MDO0995371.1 hypothetical protein [Staphylococcus borealis]OLF32098.1 hypothetical protein BSZ10_03865 [Staphylococcus aureus]